MNNCHPMFEEMKAPFQGTFHPEISIFCDIIDTGYISRYIIFHDEIGLKMLVKRSADGLAGGKSRRVKRGNFLFLGRFLGSFLLDGDHNHQRVVGFMERFKGVSAMKNNI